MKLHSEEELKQNGVKYIISIGKRQPMHVEHKKCIAKLLSLVDYRLIFAIGSSNQPGDKLFDPITNPLSVEEQIKQFKIVFPEANPIFIAVDDDPDMGKWGDLLIDALSKHNILPQECVIYFIGKEEDRLVEEVKFTKTDGDVCVLKEGEWLIEALRFWGFAFWYDKDIQVNLDISARKLRKLDLEYMSAEERNLFAAPDFIISLAKAAREANPEKDKIKDFPLTMYDISLRKMNGF